MVWTQKKIIEDFNSLPPEGQKTLINFIEFLKIKYSKVKAKKTQKQSSLKRSKFIGIWKDRGDMRNSEKYVIDLRKREWRNQIIY